MGEAKRRNFVHLDPKPVDPLKTISKNDLYRILCETQTMLFEMRKDIDSIQNIHAEDIRKEIDKQFGERVKFIDELLADVVVQKEVLYEKEIITREDVTKKLNDMRSQAKNA